MRRIWLSAIIIILLVLPLVLAKTEVRNDIDLAANAMVHRLPVLIPSPSVDL